MEYPDFKKLLENMNDTYTLPTGRSVYNINIPGTFKIELDKLTQELNSNNNSSCDHNYVNVGFHFDKFVCSKCNKDKV